MHIPQPVAETPTVSFLFHEPESGPRIRRAGAKVIEKQSPEYIPYADSLKEGIAY